MQKLHHNAHSVFLMYYHLVLVIKYRRKVIDDEISARLREIFEYIAPNYGLAVEEWNHDRDHVHVLFTGQTLIKVPAVGSSKKNFLLSVKNFGKDIFGVRVFVC